MTAPAAAARPAYFATGWTGGRNPWAIALVVTLATFMEILDTSIANVALPHMAGSLSVSRDQATWVLTSYLVANAIVLPVSGWVASRIGRKRFYMTCVALFTGSSFLCGMAPSLGWLVFFRILQGIGGGGLGPSEQAILADTFPPAKRGMAFAMYGMAVVLAPAIGPTLGGFITDHFEWRWVFFINVPVGLASLWLSNRLVTDPPHIEQGKGKSGPIDYIGFSLLAVGLGTLEVVLDKGQEDDWFHSSFITGFSAIAVVGLVAFVLWELHVAHPVVDVRLFRDRSFAASNLLMLTLGLSLYGTTVLLPQYLQVQMHYSAERAGMALSPGGFLIMALMPLVGRLVSKVEARPLIAFGFTMVSAALFYMSTHLSPEMDFGTAVSMRAIQSVGLAFLFVPINTSVFSSVSPEKNNAVSGMVNLSRNMGGDIGIALVTTVIARRTQVHQAHLVAHATDLSVPYREYLARLTHGAAHAGAGSIDATKRALAAAYFTLHGQATTLAYIDTVRVMGTITVCMLPLLLFVRKNRPGIAMGH